MAQRSRKATGPPKTWRKTKRITPIERFRMYNPLHMEFSQHPSFAKTTHKKNV